jgi:hypothetical protein
MQVQLESVQKLTMANDYIRHNNPAPCSANQTSHQNTYLMVLGEEHGAAGLGHGAETERLAEGWACCEAQQSEKGLQQQRCSVTLNITTESIYFKRYSPEERLRGIFD